MRAVTIAAAGAAIVGSVQASGHLDVHAKLHARGEQPHPPHHSTTPKVHHTTPEVVPEKPTTSAWADWKDVTTTPEVVPSQPATTSSAWADWKDVTTTPEVVPSQPTTTSSAWADWEDVTTTTTPEVVPSQPTTTSSAWADWEDVTTTTTPEVVPSQPTTSQWADWKDVTTTPEVVPTKPHDHGPHGPDTTETVTRTETETVYVPGHPTGPDVHPTSPEVVPSQPATTSSWGDWAPAPPSSECHISISTSYGLPTWYPTPGPNTTEWVNIPTTTPEVVPEQPTTTPAWSDWADVTTTPEVVPEQPTTTPAWSDWADVTTTPEVVPEQPTTTPAWSDWADVTTTPEVVPEQPTTSSAWADWEDVTTTTPEVVPSQPTTTSSAWADWEDVTTTTPEVVPSQPTTSGWADWADVTTTAGVAKPTGGAHHGGGHKGIWAWTYTPFTGDSKCKTDSQIIADMKGIAATGATVVRLFSTECNQLTIIGGVAEELGLTVAAGLWIAAGGIDRTLEELADLIEFVETFGVDLLEMTIVGSEALFAGLIDVNTLISVLDQVRAALAKVGFAGIITTAEILPSWKNHPELCEHVDKPGMNGWSFFNKETPAEKTGEFILAQIAELRQVCDKEVYITECGYPRKGSANGQAIPGPQQQKAAIESLFEAGVENVMLFSYEDETYKPMGEWGIEQSFGLKDIVPDLLQVVGQTVGGVLEGVGNVVDDVTGGALNLPVRA